MTVTFSNGLPDSWLHIRFGDVVDYGNTTKVEPDSIHPDTWVLKLEDIEKDTSRLLNRATYADRQSKSTKNAFRAGDVLYGKLRPYLNKVLLADADGVCTTEIVPIPGNIAVHSPYAYYWMRHPTFIRYVTEVSHGINMPRLGTDAGRNAPFVLAPLPEQKRIADKLDTVLTSVDACRERLGRVPTLLRRFRQSLLAAATSGRLTEDWRAGRSELSAWSETTLGQVIREMRNGLSSKPAEHPPGSKILRISAVRPGRVDFTDHRFLDVDPTTEAQYALRVGDVLFTRYNGSLEFVGACALVRSALDGYVYPDKLIRVQVDEAMVLPEYIEIAFGSDDVRRQIEAFVKSSAGQKGISGGDLKTTRLRLPSIEEQREIVLRVETLFAFADRLDACLARAQTATERLTPALLAKAFRGELVPQDPTDEPAAELLKRLAEQRSRAGGAVKTLRGRKTSPATLPEKENSIAK